jgi:nucleoid-associated protein EbfC
MEPGGQLDMQQLFAAAAQMQSQLMSAQQQLAETEVEGSAGGGLVTVTINGQGELVDVTIRKDAIDPADLEDSAQTIADLVLAACRDAYEALGEVQSEMMGPLAGGLGDLGASAGIPGLPGMPGTPGLTPPQIGGQPGGYGQPLAPDQRRPVPDEPGPGEPMTGEPMTGEPRTGPGGDH